MFTTGRFICLSKYGCMQLTTLWTHLIIIIGQLHFVVLLFFVSLQDYNISLRNTYFNNKMETTKILNIKENSPISRRGW